MAVKACRVRALFRFSVLFAALGPVLGCGQSGGDNFPGWLVLVENKTGFNAIVEATDQEFSVEEASRKTGSLRDVARIEYAPVLNAGIDSSRIFVYTYREKGETLFALDATSLLPLGSWDRSDWYFPPNDLSPVMKAVPAGFISGGWLFDPADLAADPVPLVVGSAYGDTMVFSGGDPAHVYAIMASKDEVSGTFSIKIMVYDEDVLINTGIVGRVIGNDILDFRLVDSEYIGDAYRLLFNVRFVGEDQSHGYVFSFGTEASLLSAAPLFAADRTPVAGAEVTGPFSLYDASGWLTADGVVAWEWWSGFRLVLYAYGAASSVVDEFIITGDTDGLDILSFEPGGTWWFMYDDWAGVLYKMRTWW